MKLYISTDMEGIGGISSWNEMEFSVRGKECNDLLMRELDWLLDEINRTPAGKDIEEICICDSHSRGENLTYGSLDDPRITHIKGYPRPFYMMEGLDESFDVVLFVGYHARIGALRGAMDHAYSASAIYNVRINGREVGETEINSYFASMFGVPVGLISGDDVLEEELKGFFPTEPAFARTKEGISRYSGKMYSPQRVEENFRAAARKMMNSLDSLRPVELPSGDITLSIDFPTTVVADAVSVIPGYVRTSGRTAEYVTSDYTNIMRMILATAMLGGRFSTFT